MANISNLRFKKTDRASDREFTLDTNMLKLLMALDGQKTVQEVSRGLHLDPSTFKATFIKLVKLGLIEQVADLEACVAKTLIDSMRKTLIQLIGPLGEVLVDDTAEDMGWKVNRIPVAGLADFVTAVSKEIPGDKQSNEFKKLMLKEMRNQG